MIEKRKLPINDISLVDIADDYINFVSSVNGVSISEKTQFIFIASTLTLMKSKSLLPSLDLTDEEEGDIEDLKMRIIILKQYQDAGDLLRKYMRPKPLWYFPRQAKTEILFTPHDDVSSKNLLLSIQDIFNTLPEVPQKKKEGSITIAVHIEYMMASLEKRIQRAIKIDFKSFVGQHIQPNMPAKQIRVYKVVSFLAMLELVRNGALHVIQKKNFSSINIEHV
jgi:segregation and condensation protein A